jgi:hypothetical protein
VKTIEDYCASNEKPSAQEKVAFEIAARVGGLVPTSVWAVWPSHSMREWQDTVFCNVLKVLKEHNMREAG